ncbi:hypothetical protein BJ912DRAFT_865427 [Pholiota molesta]|nr:hypothetical protein BJ912DRAFT_865427 [Pholiota molesta]
MPTNSATLPATGLAAISVIAGLANPHMLPSTKTIIFDTQLFLESNCVLLGSLRYFNAHNKSFSDSASLYVIYATVSHFQPTIYMLMSQDHETINENVEALPIIIDPCQAPVVHLTGVTSDCCKDIATFRLDIEQYISTFRDATRSTEPGIPSKPMTPFLCHFPESGKYKHTKTPMP